MTNEISDERKAEIFDRYTELRKQLSEDEAVDALCAEYTIVRDELMRIVEQHS